MTQQEIIDNFITKTSKILTGLGCTVTYEVTKSNPDLIDKRQIAEGVVELAGACAQIMVFNGIQMGTIEK
jgi:hypothetical protein